MAQLEGSGQGAIGSYDAQGYGDLVKFLEDNPLKDGDIWLSLLLRKNEMLAMRIMEVRAAYSADDFEWHKVEQMAVRDLRDGNMKLMRGYAESAFKTAAADKSSLATNREEGV